MMFHIGIDEAGRGPLAGPVAVGGVWARKEYPFLDVFSGVADSKVLSPKKREKIFTMLEEKTKEGDVRFHVALIGADIIDTQGIAHAVRVGVREVCEKLSGEVSHTKVYLDGLIIKSTKKISMQSLNFFNFLENLKNVNIIMLELW